MDEQGMTLLEVIVTTIMLGLIASVVAFGVDHYLMYGKNKIVEADLATLSTAVKLYKLDHDQTLPADPENDLQPYLPEWPTDPYSKNNSGYTIELRSGQIYIGSCGPDGVVDYGETGNSDDIYQYIK